MPATIRKSKEPANTKTVKAVEMVKAVVTKSLPAKYFCKFHQSLLFPFLDR